jgi:hypothetical protein
VTYLGLEDNKYGEDTDRDNLTEDSGEEHKVEGLNQNPNKIYHEDANHDIWGTCTAHSTISTIKQRCHQEYIY